MSHLGRPKGVEEKYSLKHILKTTSVLGVQVKFVSDCIGQEAENAAAALKSGEVLLENLRSIVRKKQEVLLRRTISSLGNIYVNDALNCSQSACSTTIIAQFFESKMLRITIG
jgi:phosphoglycerate kinase